MRPMGRWSSHRVRGALIAIVVSGGLALTGCASIDELKDAISRWLDTGSLGEPEASPEDLPRAISMTSPQNPKAETNAVSKRRDKPARNQRTAEAPRKPSHPVPIKAAEPQGTEAQSAPPASMRLHTLYPEAPAPGVFAR